MTKHHKDPPPRTTPTDYVPTGAIYNPRRTIKRSLAAFAVAGAAGFTYAIMPIAFAMGGAALGVWWIASDFRDWLARRASAAEN